MTANGHTVVDTDIHIWEPMEELVQYFEDPWKTRLERGWEDFARRAFFPKSTGDRFVGGRLDRNVAGMDSSYPGEMHPEEIPEGMDYLGVDKCLVLSHLILAAAPALGGDDTRMTTFTSGATDYLLEEVVDPDEGIYTAIPIPLDDPDDAVELIDRVGDERGITGIYMITGGAEPPLGNRQYEPVYQAAAEKDLTVCYHTSGAGIDNYHIKGYEKMIETHTLGFVENNFAQAVSVLVQGIPEKFPELDFVFLEAGIFYVSLLMSRLDCEYLKRPSEAPLLDKRPSEYIKESFYFGTQPLETEVAPKYLETVIEMIGGADRLMYASDYPHWDFDRPKRITDQSFLSDEEKSKILGANAEEVFGI